MHAAVAAGNNELLKNLGNVVNRCRVVAAAAVTGMGAHACMICWLSCRLYCMQHGLSVCWARPTHTFLLTYPASVMCCALAAVARALVLVAKCLHTRHQLNAHVSAALLLLAAAARALVFVAKFFDGKVPAATAKGQEAVDALGAAVAAKVQEYIAAMEKVR